MSESSDGERTHVLLVEDNPGDVRLVREAFDATTSDVVFHAVGDGEAAIEYIEQHLSNVTDSTPELILLDLNLPRKDGFSVLEQLDRKFDVTPPVVILSSSSVEEDIERSYSKGANAYLTKPDGMDEYESMAQSITDFWIDEARTPASVL